MKIPIKKCPHCGCDDEFYIKTRMYGRTNYYYKYDGEFTDNSTMHDDLTYRESKYVYCGDCDKRLFEVDWSGEDEKL